jgi:hypothetical protein
VLTKDSSPAEDSDADFESEHEYRREKVALSDPVHTIALRDYLQTQVTVFFPLLNLFFSVPCALIYDTRLNSQELNTGREETTKKSVKVYSKHFLEN